MPDQIKEVLACDHKIADLAKEIYQNKSMLVMGRGYNFATCLEGALVMSLVFFVESANFTLR